MSFLGFATLAQVLQKKATQVPDLENITLRHINLFFALLSRLRSHLSGSEDQLLIVIPSSVVHFLSLCIDIPDSTVLALWDIIRPVLSPSDFDSSGHYVSDSIIDDLFRKHATAIPGISMFSYMLYPEPIQLRFRC